MTEMALTRIFALTIVRHVTSRQALDRLSNNTYDIWELHSALCNTDKRTKYSFRKFRHYQDFMGHPSQSASTLIKKVRPPNESEDRPRTPSDMLTRLTTISDAIICIAVTFKCTAESFMEELNGIKKDWKRWFKFAPTEFDDTIVKACRGTDLIAVFNSNSCITIWSFPIWLWDAMARSAVTSDRIHITRDAVKAAASNWGRILTYQLDRREGQTHKRRHSSPIEFETPFSDLPQNSLQIAITPVFPYPKISRLYVCFVANKHASYIGLFRSCSNVRRGLQCQLKTSQQLATDTGSILNARERLKRMGADISICNQQWPCFQIPMYCLLSRHVDVVSTSSYTRGWEHAERLSVQCLMRYVWLELRTAGDE
ncbi:hypothetical protein V8E54_006168 [Elaphomyces granulatus]